jgi:hypothetical protein
LSLVHQTTLGVDVIPEHTRALFGSGFYVLVCPRDEALTVYRYCRHREDADQAFASASVYHDGRALVRYCRNASTLDVLRSADL